MRGIRILFASGTMSGGGAERVVSSLANHFAALGYQVDILVVRGVSIYPLDPRVRLTPVFSEAEIQASLWNKVWRRLAYFPRLLGLLKRYRPDVVIPVHGGGWNGQFVFMCWLLGIKVIAAEHISWTVGRKRFGRWIERHVVYRIADALAVLTDADKAYYQQFLPRVVKIPNPVSFAPPDIDRPGSRTCTILAAGRLDSWHHKGFDSLIAVFAQVAAQRPHWRLQIAGAGSTGMAYLQSLAVQHGVADKVDFLGFRQDLAALFGESGIFVLSSRYEGFGMVLLEAMSQGCPCVSYDCPSGPADMIDDGHNGLLVRDQDEAGLAAAIVRLIDDVDLRAALGGAAIEKAGLYRVEAIGERWLELMRAIGASTDTP